MKKNFNLSFNQLSLPFGQTSQGRKGLTISYDDRAKAFWFLAGACIFALVVYIYAVNATAHHVAERAALERQSANLSTELATLEFESIALKNDVTLDVAHQYGFQEVAKPLYVASDQAESLSFNTNRP